MLQLQLLLRARRADEKTSSRTQKSSLVVCEVSKVILNGHPWKGSIECNTSLQGAKTTHEEVGTSSNVSGIHRDGQVPPELKVYASPPATIHEHPAFCTFCGKPFLFLGHQHSTTERDESPIEEEVELLQHCTFCGKCRQVELERDILVLQQGAKEKEERLQNELRAAQAEIKRLEQWNVVSKPTEDAQTMTESEMDISRGVLTNSNDIQRGQSPHGTSALLVDRLATADEANVVKGLRDENAALRQKIKELQATQQDTMDDLQHTKSSNNELVGRVSALKEQLDHLEHNMVETNRDTKRAVAIIAKRVEEEKRDFREEALGVQIAWRKILRRAEASSATAAHPPPPH